MNLVPGFQGNQFLPETSAYERANQSYASSTYGEERNLKPGEILQPTSVEDIQHVMKYANESKKPVAIRSGGHQYSGAFSTGPDGIQLDLKPTFRRPKLDLELIRDTENDKVYIRTSVSWSLSEFYQFIKENGVFLPTGQCATVCLGGHVQTGGYGMLSRSFGLLGDYVVKLEIIDHKGDVVVITKETHPDLFYGFLGGSPGNMGVLTHFTVEVQEDRKHEGSKGMWMAFPFRKDTLKALLDILVEKSEDEKFERNYDFTVNVLSSSLNLLDRFPGSESELKKSLPNEVRSGNGEVDLLQFKYALIIVYGQWINLGEDNYSPDLFDRIKNVPRLFRFGKETPPGCPVSEIMSWWILKGEREFPYPYVKRTNNTKSTTLSNDGWSDWFSGRISEALADKKNGLWIASQMQVIGGENSMFIKNASSDTAYSWRDSTVIGTWDVFYQGARDKAEEWQKKNDEGSLVHYSKEDRRVLWGSYGDWDMKNVWKHYYDVETYKKLQQIRKDADPQGVFTSNPFCVEAAT